MQCIIQINQRQYDLFNQHLVNTDLKVIHMSTIAKPHKVDHLPGNTSEFYIVLCIEGHQTHLNTLKMALKADLNSR
jgi:hypothetical protein